MINVVYFLQRDDGAIKIGTTSNFPARFDALENEHGILKQLGVMSGTQILEKFVHGMFEDLRIEGEWFNPSFALGSFIKREAHLDPADQ